MSETCRSLIKTIIIYNVSPYLLYKFRKHVSIHKTWRYRIPQPAVPSARQYLFVCALQYVITKYYLYFNVMLYYCDVCYYFQRTSPFETTVVDTCVRWSFGSFSALWSARRAGRADFVRNRFFFSSRHRHGVITL